MSKAADYPDRIRQLVVTGISIRVQEAFVSQQEALRVIGASGLLVFVEHQLLTCVSPCPVEPHITLRLGFTVLLVQHLQCGFVRVEDIFLQQKNLHQVPDRFQPELTGSQQPVGHRLPGKRNPSSLENLLHPVQRRICDKLCVRQEGNCLRSCIAAGDNRRISFRADNYRIFIIYRAFLAGIGEDVSFLNHRLSRDQLQPANNVFTDLFHFLAAIGAFQIIPFEALVNRLYLHIFREIRRIDKPLR